MSKILLEKGFLSKIRPSFASACVRPSKLGNKYTGKIKWRLTAVKEISLV